MKHTIPDDELMRLDIEDARRRRRETCMHRGVMNDYVSDGLLCLDCNNVVTHTEVILAMAARIDKLERGEEL